MKEWLVFFGMLFGVLILTALIFIILAAMFNIIAALV